MSQDRTLDLPGAASARSRPFRGGSAARLVAAILVSVAAVVTAGAGIGRMASLAMADEAREALARAERSVRGPARDEALMSALALVQKARLASPSNAAMPLYEARIRYLQATTATIDVVSPTLLAAAADAVDAASRIDRNSAGALALSALVAHSRGMAKSVVGDLGARSYALNTDDPLVGMWRLESVSLAWTELPRSVQAAAETEVCARLSGGEQDWIAAVSEVASPEFRKIPTRCPEPAVKPAPAEE